MRQRSFAFLAGTILLAAVGCGSSSKKNDAAAGGSGGSAGAGGGGAGGGGAGGSGGAGGTSADAARDMAAPGDTAPSDAVVDAAREPVPPSEVPPPVDGPPAATMSFFVTSKGKGTGGDLGGLTGADMYCKSLAPASVREKNWVAYLSTEAGDGGAGVNARDRIGTGPWFNFAGTMIAASVAQLHEEGGMMNAVNKANSLDELGRTVLGYGDVPVSHDVLTGSNADGTVVAGATCNNWTSSGATPIALVGHSDRTGPPTSANPVKSWNSAHASSGCQEGRAAMSVGSGGGLGSIYCFAK
jgi:hypothetical protein